jgi:tetratricopeptide (TPR) repeat protein
LLAELHSTSRPGQADRAARAFEEAVGLLERGRAVPAVTAAEEAKRAAPRSGSVREVLGMALYQAERYREALGELQAYRRITGRVDQSHLIGDCHRALGQPGKAVDAAREALRPGLPEEVRAEATVVGAAALADMERFPEAVAMIRSFRTRKQGARPFDLRVWYATGDILARAGRRTEAAEEFRKIMRHEPDAFDAAERLAELES